MPQQSKPGSGGGPAAAGRTPPRKAPPRPRKQRPWGWIVAFAMVGVLAVTGVVFAVLSLERREEAAAAPIEGVVEQDYEAADHTADDAETVAYDVSPPFGGKHSPVWADCTGTVYDTAIRDENAIHSLEHGAVWIAYRPDLPASDVAALAAKVRGVDYTMLSPYPGLTEAVSVQSWGFQLRVDDVADPRIDAFLTRYRQNPETTPEFGASCVNPGYASQMDTEGNVSPS